MSDQQIDPSLADHLDRLTELANIIGAEGVFVFRGIKNARMIFHANPGAKADDTLVNFDIADAELLVVMRFPAGDGGEPGIESR